MNQDMSEFYESTTGSTSRNTVAGQAGQRKESTGLTETATLGEVVKWLTDPDVNRELIEGVSNVCGQIPAALLVAVQKPEYRSDNSAMRSVWLESNPDGPQNLNIVALDGYEYGDVRITIYFEPDKLGDNPEKTPVDKRGAYLSVTYAYPRLEGGKTGSQLHAVDVAFGSNKKNTDTNRFKTVRQIAESAWRTADQLRQNDDGKRMSRSANQSDQPPDKKLFVRMEMVKQIPELDLPVSKVDLRTLLGRLVSEASINKLFR